MLVANKGPRMFRNASRLGGQRWSNKGSFTEEDLNSDWDEMIR